MDNDPEVEMPEKQIYLQNFKVMPILVLGKKAVWEWNVWPMPLRKKLHPSSG
jgi:hypothetical protein